jgi:hypothetical protein
MFLYILILIVILFFVFSPKRESFTSEQQDFAEILSRKFQNGEIRTFTKYLLILTELQNTNDSLISKGVYNKFMEKSSSLSKDDILNQME